MPIQPLLMDHISDDTMQEMWYRTPIDFQREVIPRLLSMQCVLNRLKALQLVQDTGGGKSAVAKIVGIVDCGVTPVLEEALALAADQKSKIRMVSNKVGPVLVYQFSSIKQRHLVSKLEKRLLELTKTSHCSVFLYASWEYLSDNHDSP